jgi:hypothetical protein
VIALSDDSVQLLNDMVRRWSSKRLNYLRRGDEGAARQVGDWLFGLELTAESLGLIHLAARASEAQFADPAAHAPQVQS